MSFNTFGRVFRFSTWGESHGPALGAVVDGCPPGLALSEADLRKGLTEIGMGARRIKIVTGSVGAPAAAGSTAAAKPDSGPKLDDEVSQRALAHPEVQRFQKAFPEAQVRQVKDLKE